MFLTQFEYVFFCYFVNEIFIKIKHVWSSYTNLNFPNVKIFSQLSCNIIIKILDFTRLFLIDKSDQLVNDIFKEFSIGNKSKHHHIILKNIIINIFFLSTPKRKKIVNKIIYLILLFNKFFFPGWLLRICILWRVILR